MKANDVTDKPAQKGQDAPTIARVNTRAFHSWSWPLSHFHHTVCTLHCRQKAHDSVERWHVDNGKATTDQRPSCGDMLGLKLAVASGMPFFRELWSATRFQSNVIGPARQSWTVQIPISLRPGFSSVKLQVELARL